MILILIKLMAFFIEKQAKETEETFKCCDGCIEKKDVNMNVFTYNTEEMRAQQNYIMLVVGINKGEKHYHDIKTGNDYCIECYETLDDKTNIELR